MTFLGVAAVVLLALAAVVGIRLSRKPVGLKAFVQRVARDKTYSQQVSARVRRRAERMSEARAAPPPADFELPALLRDLLDFDNDAHDAAATRIAASEKRAIPTLLAAMDDPRCTWQQDEPGDYGSSPALRVCRLLYQSNCRTLGDRIGHLVDSPDRQTRSLAIKARAALGRSSEIAFVLEHLNSDDTAAQSSGQEGIDKEVAEGWAEPEFVVAVLEWARQSIFDTGSRRSDWAVRFFAAHGGADAIRALQSPEILNLQNNRTIHYVLEELAARKIHVPGPLLEAILKRSTTEDSWPWPWAWKPSLDLLALTDVDAATRLANEQIGHTNESIARQSIEFVRESNGLPRIWQIESSESASLSAEEREIIKHSETCSEAIGQIGNGGLSQYFFNSSGDRWPQVCKSFNVFGFAEGAETLEKAARLIHKAGASLDRNTRIQQIASLSSAQYDAFDSLSSTFWGLNWQRIELRFMLRHKALFQRIKNS